jgi:hypothetical protein
MNRALRVRLEFNAAQKMFLIFVFGCGVLAIVIMAVRLISGPLPVQQLTYSELLQQINNGNVRDATILTSKKNAVKVAGVIKVPEKSFRVPLERTEIENSTQASRSSGSSDNFG